MGNGTSVGAGPEQAVRTRIVTAMVANFEKCKGISLPSFGSGDGGVLFNR